MSLEIYIANGSLGIAGTFGTLMYQNCNHVCCNWFGDMIILIPNITIHAQSMRLEGGMRIVTP